MKRVSTWVLKEEEVVQPLLTAAAVVAQGQVVGCMVTQALRQSS